MEYIYIVDVANILDLSVSATARFLQKHEIGIIKDPSHCRPGRPKMVISIHDMAVARQLRNDFLDMSPNKNSKICVRCKIRKILNEFPKMLRKSGRGWRSKCFPCYSNYLKEHRSKLPAPTVAEKICNRCRELKPIQEFYRKYAGSEQRHPCCRACYGSMQKKRPGYRKKKLQNNRTRWSRQKNSDGKFTVSEWENLCQKHGGICLACKVIKPLTADHIIPLSKGGSSYIENIQPLCRECNSSKNAKTADYRLA